MQTQEYELTDFRTSDFKDQNGNTWCDAVFKGVGEPVKWVVKDPAKVSVGQKYFGTITQETSKANKPYQRFRRANRPDEQQKREYQPRDDMAIRAQWAIGQAIAMDARPSQVGMSQFDGIEETAKVLFSMVDRVKASSASTTSGVPTKPEAASSSSWEQARQKFNSQDRQEDEEIKSLFEQVPEM